MAELSYPNEGSSVVFNNQLLSLPVNEPSCEADQQFIDRLYESLQTKKRTADFDLAYGVRKPKRVCPPPAPPAPKLPCINIDMQWSDDRRPDQSQIVKQFLSIDFAHDQEVCIAFTRIMHQINHRPEDENSMQTTDFELRKFTLRGTVRDLRYDYTVRDPRFRKQIGSAKKILEIFRHYNQKNRSHTRRIFVRHWSAEMLDLLFTFYDQSLNQNAPDELYNPDEFEDVNA